MDIWQRLEAQDKQIEALENRMAKLTKELEGLAQIRLQPPSLPEVSTAVTQAQDKRMEALENRMAKLTKELEEWAQIRRCFTAITQEPKPKNPRRHAQQRFTAITQEPEAQNIADVLVVSTAGTQEPKPKNSSNAPATSIVPQQRPQPRRSALSAADMAAIARIQGEVARFYNMTVEQLLGQGKEQKIAAARMMAMYLARELTCLSWPAIGRAFGRHHATAIHAHQVISRCASRAVIEQLRNSLREPASAVTSSVVGEVAGVTAVA